MQATAISDLPTLDLSELANVHAGETIVVEAISDRTQDLFEETLDIFEMERQSIVSSQNQVETTNPSRFIPKHEDLRKIYLFAEALGGYEALNELVNDNSKINQLSDRFENTSTAENFSPKEIQQLEEQQQHLNEALKSANLYLSRYANQDFDQKELSELHNILVNASIRNKQMTQVLGIYKMAQIEKAIARLYEFQEKIQSVKKDMTGIFLIDSEILFIPTQDLIECVNVIFNGIGNPYLTDNIDGVMLLAARNLLIQAVSFYSYYGKERIYNLVKKSGNTLSTGIISFHIQEEIKSLFKACKTDNKLVLKRVMNDAERNFEISVEEIQTLAEKSALQAVKKMLPQAIPEKKIVKRSFFKKILSWLKS